MVWLVIDWMWRMSIILVIGLFALAISATAVCFLSGADFYVLELLKFLVRAEQYVNHEA
ncbi:MAG: hypothetical protein LBJ00_06630 [Planctomycetaceae bacterium]|nr:hypothetical protein [Planctomycetaceae bacterium]